MGRVKLRIKRLESLSNRKVTYSKRRNGLLKKARELSILCDIGICLLMFSPTGKPTLFCGEHSSFEDVITKFSQLTPLERAKRKLVCLEALKKTFKKEGHDINVHDFLGPSQQTVEDLSNHVRLLQSQLSEMHRRLSGWSDPEQMNNMEQIRQLEDSLKESLNQINESKENFQKQEPVPLESTSQLQNGMHMPMPMSSIQECLPLSWIPHNENQHMPYYLLSQDPNFFLKREMECSGEASFPGYSGYGSTSGQTEFGNIGQINHTGQGGGALNQFGNAMDMGLEMNEQYPNAFYSHLDFSDENDFKQRAEMNLGGTPLDYQSGCSFKLNEPLYENGQHSSEHCVATMFDENAYPHQPN